MLPRFLVPDLDAQRADALLPPEEAHHLSRVLRVKVGAEVAVFDGRGREFRARVASIDRDVVTVRLLDPVAPLPSPTVPLTLVQSVLKRESMDAVVRDCTMIGVDSIQPVVSARTTVKTSLVTKAAERWRRVALASTKQCGRAQLPQIHDAMSFEEWARHGDRSHTFVLLEPAAAVPKAVRIRELAGRPAPPHASVVVGPEGGWTPDEVDLAIAAGCTPLSLGRLILRADAVPLAATAALLAIWDE
jgi:16S rRNA (uracil1498-N3)-methyltransferase